MKTKGRKRLVSLLALLLTALMLLTLMGCNKGDSEDTPTQRSKKPKKTSVSTSASATETAPLTDEDGSDMGVGTTTTGTVNSELELSELYAQIGVAEYLTPSDYTADSWADLEQALQQAKDARYAATQDEVDGAVSELQAAIDGLVEASGTVPTGGSSNQTTTANKPTSTTKSPSTTKNSNTTTTTNKPTSTTKSSTTTTKTQPTTQTVLNQVPSSLSGTKIKMLIWWNQSTDDTNEAAAFKKATGISVAYETASLNAYQSNLSGKIMAGNPPALAAIINEWYPQPITRGLMQPIKNTGWDYTDSIYNTSLMDQFSYKGVQYGVALKGSTMTTYEVMFFNKKVLKSNGVTQDPYTLWRNGQWNWDTCLDIAQKCTNTKQGKYGLTLISQYYWMLSAGQDFVLSDTTGLKNNVKSSKLLDTWYRAWDMIFTHKVIPTNFSNQQSLFYDGSVAMLGAGSYFMQANGSRYVPKNMTDEWGVVPFPSPKGQTAVAACEGTVWGFPSKVTGNQLQAAMWYLRYYLDDANYGDDAFYPNDNCWEVMEWMSNQKTQSYNSVGVITYGGKHTAAAIQFDLIDRATTKAQIRVNLDSWFAEFQTNIDSIHEELS